MTDRAEIDRFLRIVTSEGKSEPEFHLYAARRKGEPDLVAPLPAGNARTYVLSDETWPYQVAVFELSPHLAPTEVPGALLRALEDLMSQGAPLVWLMFDAVFDGVNSLTTDWGAQSTYGVAGAATAPTLALTEDGRRSAGWKETIRQTVEHFEQSLLRSRLSD
ncbi:MAG TPA: hypothetical protein VFA20_03705 [Myxococcaceae bacterium]|nr:hypothetical protein [Myxococcaceae bacterium]